MKQLSKIGLKKYWNTIFSHFNLLNISHMAHIIMNNIAESDYNRSICGDLFEFLSLKCPCPNEH